MSGLIPSLVLGIGRPSLASIILGFCFLVLAVVWGWRSIRSARLSACSGLTPSGLNSSTLLMRDLFIGLYGTECKDSPPVAEVGPFAGGEAEEWLRKGAFSRDNIRWVLGQGSNLEVHGILYLGLPVGGLVAYIHKLDSPQDVAIVIN